MPTRYFVACSGTTESGIIVQAGSVAELAARTAVSRAGLTVTVERFNGFARSGVDEDFKRGESAYDRYYGGPTNKPNRNLGELSHPPYYAAKMVQCSHRRQRSRPA